MGRVSRGVRLGRLKRPGGDCGGAQRDKDPGVLAGDLGGAVSRRGGRKGRKGVADGWGPGVGERGQRACGPGVRGGLTSGARLQAVRAGERWACVGAGRWQAEGVWAARGSREELGRRGGGFWAGSGGREAARGGVGLGRTGERGGLRVGFWVLFWVFPFYFYLLSHFKSKSNKG